MNDKSYFIGLKLVYGENVGNYLKNIIFCDVRFNPQKVHVRKPKNLGKIEISVGMEGTFRWS